MKLQISFDMIDLDRALAIASQVAPHADIIEIGTLLLYTHGIRAVKQFRKELPNKIILADAKIIDRAKEAVTLLAQAGADWITVMAGTNKSVIHTCCTTAHEQGKRVMLDLLDAASIGQSVMEAKNLGADASLFHHIHEEQGLLTLRDTWEMVKGNSSLPIFISAHIDRTLIEDVLALKPDGVVIGRAITEAEDPAAEAESFRAMLSS